MPVASRVALAPLGLEERARPGAVPLQRPGILIAYLGPHARQLLRFILIGATLTALNLCVLYWLRTRLHLYDPIAVSAMYFAGALVHFTAHRFITYEAQDRPVLPQGARYAFMLVWNFLVLQALLAAAASLSWWPYVAVILSTGCNMVFNFLFMTHVVFARTRIR
ncbi:MAG: GtrA family protein [Alphaproteobacteria bacterium]|nr:GtrA family protein [Alphaproteobacteria bacterium]